MSAMRNFADVLYQRRLEADSNIILRMGCDFGKLPSWLQKSKLSEFGRNWAAVSEALAVYEKYLIETISPFISGIMPRLSLYLQYGAYGLRALECTIVQALKHELPVIIDARFAEFNIGQIPLAGNSVVGRVSGWDGMQPSNLHAHAVSIIPYYGEAMIRAYIELCSKMRRGLVIVVNNDTDWETLSGMSEKLVGKDVLGSGLCVLLENEYLNYLEMLHGKNLTAFIKFSQIFDIVEIQQFWESQADEIKNKTFICLDTEINAGVNQVASESIGKDEEAVRSHFSGCSEKAEFYQKLFKI